jgi:hypothetical protein
MLPLKETRLQIQERTAREIRIRTAARLLEQLRTQFVETKREREEDSDEEDVRCRRQECRHKKLVC